MPRFVFVVVSLCFLLYSEQKSTPQDDHYIAAVVEYEVQADGDVNLQNYLQLAKDANAQNADIIVYPEMTLTRGNRTVDVPMFGLLKEYPVPANRTDIYDEILVSLSLAARQNNIYIVVNLQERLDCNDAPGEYCPEKKVYTFNTNVVFDRNGAVIDRYRKINLFGEFTRTPALKPDLGIFSTDFGVTFGHYICFDLMFQVPAIQVVEKHNLTDIVFSTMWFSEMPYLTAVQIQEAYAYAMNVNFLASGANNVKVGSAGSGIYSGKAGALVSIMPGVPTTRLLVAKVPKTPGKVTDPYPGPIYDNPSDHDNLLLKSDPSLPSHVSRLLVPGFQEFTLVDKEVSCRFRIKLNQRSGENNYQYRAVAFSGVRTYDGVATGGVRTCAVISCSGNTVGSCGERFPKYEENTTAIFEEIFIAATVPTPKMVSDLNASDTVFYPVTLRPSIMPLESKDYGYEVNSHGDITNVTLTLKNVDVELYSFAIWGRVFERDGQEPTPPLGGSAYRSFCSIVLVIAALSISMFG